MRSEKGFTLVEVMMALVILSVVMLGLAAATGSMVVRVTESGRRTEAMQLAEDRVARIQIDPSYDDLASRYEVVEDSIPGHPELVRETEIEHLGGPGAAMDHKIVTVRVTGSGLPSPVARTVAVGAP
jgi:prepilin-type N-terminal cleavage/methylation domain-containing protein